MPDTLPTESTYGGTGSDASPPALPSAKLRILNLSAIFFAVLQSICSAFIALSGVRLLIGLGAFAAATGALRFVDRIHADAIRVPTTTIALLGAVWNLVALWRVWSLRRRGASAWRRQRVPRSKRRSEFLQFGISVATLVLLALEAVAHYHLFHHL